MRTGFPSAIFYSYLCTFPLSLQPDCKHDGINGLVLGIFIIFHIMLYSTLQVVGTH